MGGEAQIELELQEMGYGARTGFNWLRTRTTDRILETS